MRDIDDKKNLQKRNYKKLQKTHKRGEREREKGLADIIPT